MLRNNKRAKPQAKPLQQQQQQQKAKKQHKKAKSLSTRAQKRSFSSSSLSSLSLHLSSDSQTTPTTPTTRLLNPLLKSRLAFKATKKLSKDAFPEDYDPDKNPQAPYRDATFEATKLIADIDPNYIKKLHASKERRRRFDNSEDSELYDGLKQFYPDTENPTPDFKDYATAKSTLHHLNDSEVVNWSHQDQRFPWLDPFNPPNLSYEHVKLLKNIDYSPLIKRANEGGMFTVEDVITILQEEGVSNAFKTSMRREHAQDPVIYAKTFDVFNRGRKPCPLCLPDPTQNRVNRIHWTNVNLLRKFITTSGMILPRKVSGVCQKHQTKIRYAIKNAKQLALLSFTSNWHVPLSYVDPEKFDSYEDQNAAADVERDRRMEIRSLFDNLVADKKAILAGKSIEDIEEERADGEMSQKRELDAVNEELMEDGKAPILQGKELEANVRETQRDNKVKQIQDKFATQIAKAGKDEPLVESLKKQMDTEISNVNSDYDKAVAEANDDNLDALRSDFGDLLNLDKFDINMGFEEFLAKYNERVVAKGIKFATHDDLIIHDSDDDDGLTVGMRLRQEHVGELNMKAEKAKDMKH